MTEKKVPFLDRPEIVERLWVSDSEVFKYDTLWVFKHLVSGETRYYHNDHVGVGNFIAEYDPILIGYNFRDYDSYILKATLLGWSAEAIQNVSLTIIEQDLPSVWQLFKSAPFITLPPIIDLFHDIVPRRGLKQIEANLGIDIVESSVSFLIERELTDAEFQDVLYYCVHDVDSTEKLYHLRKDRYVATKALLCEIAGLDPLENLKHTNARVVAEALGAVRIADLPYEEYEPPANVDLTGVPQEVLDYFRATNTRNCLDKGDTGVEFDWFGCPTKVARGGIHGAVPNYQGVATEQRLIIHQDVNSYYPSLILNNKLLSRAVESNEVYKEFYDMRLEAKASGDNDTSNAAKLVLNTTFGAQKDKYNKLFDPMQATRICYDGQLYILDLTYALAHGVPSIKFVQFNTDGWVIEVDAADRPKVDAIVAEWCERTGLGIGEEEIERIVQPNVNNYIMRTLDGEITAKGGIVTNYKGGSFTSNSCSIVDRAVAEYTLNGVPIDTTIEMCNDLMEFQIIAKAGRTYKEVIHNGVPVQKVNRVFATTDEVFGGIFKVKEGGNPEKIALTPEHCYLMNGDVEENQDKVWTRLDKVWYANLAKKKAKEFTKQEKEKKMAEKDVVVEAEVEVKKPTPKRKAAPKKAEVVAEVAQAPEVVEPVMPTFNEKLLKLQEVLPREGVDFDGMVSKINYSYADTQQYKKNLRDACTALRLVLHVDIRSREWLGVISPEGSSSSIYGMLCDLVITIKDVDSPTAASYMSSGMGANTTPGYTLGVAETNALRNFVLNNFMLDNQGRDGDDQKLNGELLNAPSGKSGYMTPAAKQDMKDNLITKAKGNGTYATDLFAKGLYDAITTAREVEPTFCEKILTTHFEEDGTPKLSSDGKSTILKADAVKIMTKAEEMVSNG